MSEENNLQLPTPAYNRNPVVILGTISFMTGIVSYLLCGIFLFSGLMNNSRTDGKEMVAGASVFAAIAILLSIVSAIVGLITGIVGTSIRRGMKLEGRGFAIAGMIISSSYTFIIIILAVVALALAVFTASALGMVLE